MYGDEEQNDIMRMINDYKGEEDMEDRMENRIAKITKDIEAYQEAIENAEGALAEAERELVEELDRRVGSLDIEMPE